MSDLGTWTYEKHPKTGKLIRVRKTIICYSKKEEVRAPSEGRGADLGTTTRAPRGETIGENAASS